MPYGQLIQILLILYSTTTGCGQVVYKPQYHVVKEICPCLKIEGYKFNTWQSTWNIIKTNRYRIISALAKPKKYVTGHEKLPRMHADKESRKKTGILRISGRKPGKIRQKKGLDTFAYRARCQLKHASEDCTII